MGQGLPLTFQLLDSAASREMVQRWSHTTYLTAPLDAVATTVTVNDTTGFPTSGPYMWIHIGLERITYTGTTPTSFTGCTRGTAGTRARRHVATGAGAIVTDQIKVWRGRGIRLWAVPMSPSGELACENGNLLDEAQEVWRGYIDQGPRRESGRFAFDCLSIDRVLTHQLPTTATGKVVDASKRTAVYPSDMAELRIVGYGSGGWDYLIRIYPYADVANGTLLSVDEQRDRIIAAWAAAVTAAGAGSVVGGLSATSKITVETEGNAFLGSFAAGYRWNLQLFADAAVEYVLIQGFVGPDQITGSFGTPGGLVDMTVELPWFTNDKMLASPGYAAIAEPQGVAIQLDMVLDTVPASGLVQIGGVTFAYADSATQGGWVYLSGLKDANGNPHIWKDGKAPKGAAAKILFQKEGPLADLMLSLLTSEGGGGAYDLWGFGEGYSIDESAIDTASFAATLAGPALDLAGSIGGSDTSFESSFGGLLALAQKGVVARTDSSGLCRLGMVSTSPGGSAYKATITDAELLSLRGDPVEQVSRSEPLAGLNITLSSYGESYGPPMTLQEFAGLTEQAGRTLDLSIPVQAGQDVLDQVKAWGASLLAQSATLQTLEMKVVPWVNATVGDLVWVDVTHPNVWSWLSNMPGYTGLGRILGATRDLKDGSLLLTVLIDGTINQAGLVPSMLVLAGSGTTPSVIDVSRLHLEHLQSAFGAGTLVLRHYQPGRDNEDGGGTLTVASVTDTGSVARLVVTGSVPVAVDTAYKSTLCYPETSASNVFQNLFAHVGDGSVWS